MAQRPEPATPNSITRAQPEVSSMETSQGSLGCTVLGTSPLSASLKPPVRWASCPRAPFVNKLPVLTSLFPMCFSSRTRTFFFLPSFTLTSPLLRNLAQGAVTACGMKQPGMQQGSRVICQQGLPLPPLQGMGACGLGFCSICLKSSVRHPPPSRAHSRCPGASEPHSARCPTPGLCSLGPAPHSPSNSQAILQDASPEDPYPMPSLGSVGLLPTTQYRARQDEYLSDRTFRTPDFWDTQHRSKPLPPGSCEAAPKRVTGQRAILNVEDAGRAVDRERGPYTPCTRERGDVSPHLSTAPIDSPNSTTLCLLLKDEPQIFRKSVFIKQHVP